jgi:hypothetical protein
MKGNCVLNYQKKEGLFTKTMTMFDLGIQKEEIQHLCSKYGLTLIKSEGYFHYLDERAATAQYNMLNYKMLYAYLSILFSHLLSCVNQFLCEAVQMISFSK